MQLQNKVALVTGTSPNIGGGIAEALAEAGAAVVAVDVRPENATDCARYINGTGGRALGVAADVTDETQVEAAVAAAVAAFGTVDILVNGAVIFNRKGVLDMPFAEFEQQTKIILGGSFLFTKHVAKRMIERGGGAIINIISTAGHQGEPGNIAYSTAKAGLLNFTRSAAMELVRYNIRVNSLTPTATDRSESYDRAERWGRTVARPNSPAAQAGNAFRSRVPMQRLPVPSDYGHAAVFLASDNAAMITGTDLRVDAGAIARYWAWDPSAPQ
ncbi:MAG TPA: SDR family oxidoreductase [Stellaceae bacterium]|nr:SDR family oxidoreductase [Stellaceae bacterium]